MMKTCLKPAGHRVLVKPDTAEETDEVLAKAKAAGFTIVKDKQTERAEKAAQIYGTLVAIGDTAWKEFSDGRRWANEGDRVTYSKWGGKFITDPVTMDEFVILNDEDITCIIEEFKDD